MRKALLVSVYDWDGPALFTPFIINRIDNCSVSRGENVLINFRKFYAGSFVFGVIGGKDFLFDPE
nr:hypothetical protein [Flavihumibacter stibioxidans]